MGGKFVEEFIVTIVDRNGDMEVRKVTDKKDEAFSYFRTVEKKRLPEIWKKIDRSKKNEN